MKLVLRLIWLQAKKYPVKTGVTAVLILLTAALWVAEPMYSSYAVDAMLGVQTGIEVNYVSIFGFWALLFVTMSIVQSLEKYWSWDLDNQLVLDRREEVFQHVLNLDIAFHTKQKSGEIIKTLDEGADSLMELQRRLFLELTPSMLSAVVFLILGFMIQPYLAVILLATLIIYLLIVVVSMQKTMKEQQVVNRLWVRSIGRAFDVATNIFSVKSGAQEVRETAHMHADHVEAMSKQKHVNFKWALIEAINFFMLTRILLLAVGIVLYTKNLLTLGELYFFQASFFRVLTPFEMLGWMLPIVSKQIAKVKSAQMIIDTPILIQNKPDAIIPASFNGSVKLENICFSYGNTDVPVLFSVEEEEVPSDESIAAGVDQHETDSPFDLSTPSKNPEEEITPDSIAHPEEHAESPHQKEVLHGISLDVKPGERIAFVGHSGAGKSTLALLLNRFYDVTEGRILIDNVDLRDIDLQWWRSQIGLVLQENIMFNDSILNNIRYARPSATDAEVVEAARRAAASEFIEVLPKKYETEIGDRGIRLSGGQRQRIAIARAILKNPSIVILDEATSALDSITERKVQEGIKELIKGRTSFIIAHRLSTVRSVDRIAVIEAGRLTAIGTHEELLKISPVYKQMVDLQKEGMLAE